MIVAWGLFCRDVRCEGFEVGAGREGDDFVGQGRVLLCVRGRGRPA